MENSGGSQSGFPERRGQASIAIIEDNLEIVQLYVMLLETLGMPVSFIAHDGDAGVKAFKAAASLPDIVLIDHRMPIKNGLEAMREMLALQPTARFIFISADEGMKTEAMAAGANAFLTKPASLREIADAIMKLLAPDDQQYSAGSGN
jgi:two-component system chemotaxis response regulator CheY